MALSPIRRAISGTASAYSSSDEGNHDLGSGSEGSLYALLDGSETVVVDDADTGHCKEVRGELGAGAAHGEVAECKHECLWLLAAAVCSQTKGLEGLCCAVGLQRLHCILLVASVCGNDLTHAGEDVAGHDLGCNPVTGLLEDLLSDTALISDWMNPALNWAT